MILVNIFTTSVAMLFWQTFSSFLMASVPCDPQETIAEAQFENPPENTRGVSMGNNPKEESQKWEKYNYEPPNSEFDTPHATCGDGPEFEEFFQQQEKFHSRLAEDEIIYKSFFKDRLTGRGGNYVELGAFDGQTESNSRFFDVCLGWKGLLIEGNPATYKRTVTNRPQAHRMSFAPTCKEQSTAQFYKYPMANSGLEGKARTYEGKPTVTVPCGPLTEVLTDVFKGETIHFFSLDVEGAEPLVLETIDFNRVKIDVLMVEVANSDCLGEDCEARAQTVKIMEQAGYIRHKLNTVVFHSDVYVHPRATFELVHQGPPTVESFLKNVAGLKATSFKALT